MSRHSFLRYKNALADTFGIDIECDRRSNQYYIGNRHLLHDNSLKKWMLSTLTVSNIVSESLSIHDRILLEPIPADDVLSTIIVAMKSRHRISFLYKKHSDSEPKERLITPCCIKLFHQRWYVIDYIPHASPSFKPFAFDRISNVSISNETFELPSDFDASMIFKHSFGIFIDEREQPQKVLIRAYGDMVKYIRDLPLHHTQKQVASGANYVDYKYYIRVSTDFIAELLSKGNSIEVLSPQSLRDRIGEEHLKAANRYK